MPFSRRTRRFVGLDLEAVVEVLEREFEALGLAQRLAGLDPGLGAKGGDRRLVRQHQQVADPPGLAGELDPRRSQASCCSQNSRTSPMRSDFQSGSCRFGIR